MKFLGRTEQRKKLHRMIDKSGQTVSLVYGRRRVGKSELIKQVLRESDLPGIYYECKQTTELNNVDSLALLIAAEYNLPRPAFRSIEETLDFLFQKACRENMIFVLDEYSYLRDCVKGMDSILQATTIYLVSKKFVSFKKPMNPSKFQTHPAVLELFALCAIPAVSLKGRKNTSANNA